MRGNRRDCVARSSHAYLSIALLFPASFYKEEMNMQMIETPVAGEVRHYQMLIGGEWVDAQSIRHLAGIR